MGKRKSKTSKQKQAKAAAKSLKARSILQTHAVAKDQLQQLATNNSVFATAKARKGGKRGSPLDAERRDFQRQQASMQERQLAREQQQQQHLRSKRQRQQANNSLNKNGGFFTFAAPTFVVDDAQKSTTQLVQEAARTVQQWEGVRGEENGQHEHQPSNSNFKKISLKQVLQTSRLYESVMATDAPKGQKQSQDRQSSNRFAMLDCDSEDEERNNSSNQLEMSLFQFAPASFAVPVAAAEDDPDL